MGKALYRKYRSKNLSEIVGQEHVTTALSNSLKNRRIGHAYLFTGPRGTGKTSVARILAHEVNNLPYDESSTHLDIIEIDAASNRRIDEIRSLREKVHNAPASAKYKVYIIDEVHMLTKEAFNALLKTLEEPPAHVIFILATTEAHKLPETIISRTQRYTFKPAEKSAVAEHLKTIAKSEGIDISEEAIELVASHGQGSFRDSISLLDQVSNAGESVNLDDVRRSLGIAPEESIRELVSHVSHGSAATILSQLQSLREQGYQAPQIAKQIAKQLRTGVFENTSSIDHQIIKKVLRRLIDVPASHDPEALLELTLLDHVLDQNPSKVSEPVGPSQPKPTKQLDTEATKPSPKHKESSEKPEATKVIKDSPNQPKPNVDDTILDENAWQQVLHALKSKHNTLYGVARMATPIFSEDKLTLSFQFPFHKKRMDDNPNKKKIHDTILSELGVNVEVVCIVEQKPGSVPENSHNSAESKPDNPIDTISNIFGGAEVLE